MSGFGALMAFNPVYIALAGLITAFGAYGTGSALLIRLRDPHPPPWWHAVRFLLGIEILGLGIQILAISQSATPAVLRFVWFLFVSFGCSVAGWRAYRAAPLRKLGKLPRDGLAIAFATVIVVASASNLAIALNHSTKIDEIYYHMLVPARLLADGGLRFYSEPWMAAIVPQMAFQIGLTPLHSLGVPDAGNVVSWSASLLLMWIATANCYAVTRSARWALLSGSLIVVGLYPAVWHITSGAHAVGDLAIVAGMLGVFWLIRRPPANDAMITSGAFGILAVAAASTKVSLIALALSIQGLATLLLLRRTALPPWRILSAAAAPWLIFYFPLLIWTANVSGSPFGSLLTSVFPSTIYQAGEMARVTALSLAANQGSLLDFLVDSLLNPSVPLAVWILVVGFFCRPIHTGLALVVAALFLAQTALIATSLPHDARFFGGLHYSVAVLGAISLASTVKRQHWITAAVLVSLLPWLGVQLYYSKPFLRALVVPGERAHFRQRYIPMLEDLKALDQILPPDAQILYDGVTAPSFYSPRAPIYHERDLVIGKRAFVLVVEGTADPHQPPPGTSLNERIYVNERANTYTFRRPGADPMIGRISVYPLRSQRGASRR